MIAGLGCSGEDGISDQALGNLVIAKKTPTDPVSLDKVAKNPAELTRALTISLADPGGELLPQKVAITVSNEILEKNVLTEKLTEDCQIEIGADRAWHATYNNSGDNGREVLFAGKQLYLRPRYMKWHRRDPNDDKESAAQLRSFDASVAAYWDLVAAGSELTDGGAVTVAGRPARKVTTKLKPAPMVAGQEIVPQRSWRAARKVTSAVGDFAFDVATGRLLYAKLTGELGFERDKRAFTMKFAVEQINSDIGVGNLIATPLAADIVDTPERMREVDERDFLLDGIDPSAKKPVGALAAAAAMVPIAPTVTPITTVDAPKKKKSKDDTSSDDSQRKKKRDPDDSDTKKKKSSDDSPRDKKSTSDEDRPKKKTSSDESSSDNASSKTKSDKKDKPAKTDSATVKPASSNK
jgi:hypothetical protein